MRGTFPIITCDDEGGCPEWTLDWYEALVSNWQECMETGWQYDPYRAPDGPHLCPDHACVCPADICLGAEHDTGSTVECRACLALDPEEPCLQEVTE